MTFSENHCECDACGWQGPADKAEPCRDFWSRISPGGVVPAGDCSRCGAFVYPLATLTPNRVAIFVEGGLVQAICADRPAEVQVLVVDYDREGVSPAALVRVPQVGGGTAAAVVTAWAPEPPTVAMETLFDLIEQGGDESSLN
ncbi:MAG: hypothetical protein U1F76_14175 [Candidatus Competibacteraceae bacterium]